MIITTKSRTYRKTSNDGRRTNITVFKQCDFDNLNGSDAIIIRTSVLVDIMDYANQTAYLTSGYHVIRRFKDKLLMANRVMFKQETLEEILTDFLIEIKI